MIARSRIGMAVAATTFLAACAGAPARLDTAATARSETGKPVTTAALRDGAEAKPIQSRTSETVKIGVLLPLSGPGQAGLIASSMKNAIDMAHAEARAPHVKLVVRDDKGTPDGADTGLKELAGERVELVLGPLFARSVQAVAPAARQANLPVLAFSNDRQVAGQAVSLISFLAEPEVNRIVGYAARKGLKRQAALIPADSYGRLVETAYRAAAARHGVEIVVIETYAVETSAVIGEAVRKFRDTLRGIEEHGDPVQALFLPGGEETLASLSPHLKTNAIDTKRMKVLGTGAMDFPTAGRDGMLIGAWFASPDPKGFNDFARRYAQQHGHQPPRIAALAYDAMVVASSLSNGPDGARYIPSQLTRASGFEGIDGTFRLAADGTSERPLAILEVRADGASIVEAAVPVTQDAPSGSSSAKAPQAPAAGNQGFLSSIPSAFPPVN